MIQIRLTTLLCACLVGSLSLPSSALAQAADPSRPNIIFIMLDDLDYADVGAYGSPDIHTPTIDRLASEGMRFERFYTAGPVCSPTRASLLSGDYPARYGIKRAVLDTSFRGLPASSESLPRLLQRAGYRTAHLGKWHVGTRKPQYLPTQKGFHHSVRLETDEGLSYVDYTLSVNDERSVRYQDGPHLTETLTDQALQFLSESLGAHPESPVFMNLWYLAPHKPLFQLPADFDNSETRYCLEDDSFLDDCSVARGNFAALVTYADAQIQRIMDFLEQRPELERNTLVIVASDNGGERYTHGAQALPERQLRGYKGDVFEGAIRVPFIARWPGTVSAGTVNTSVISSVDVLPTLMQIAGMPAPNAGPGESFLQALTAGVDQSRPAPLFWENKHSNDAFSNTSGVLNTYAVTDGDWKLVLEPARNRESNDRLHLFNLRSDPFERESLLPVAPRPPSGLRDRARRMLDAWLEDEKPHSHNVSASALAAKLQAEYLAWRRREGNIGYDIELDPVSVRRERNWLRLSGGRAALSADERVDFDDGDFSFLTRIRMEDASGRATIAVKRDSWHLFVEEGSLKLELFGRNGPQQPVSYTLEAPLGDQTERHVAFTVFGWRDDPSTVKLYLDGALVDGTQSGEGFRYWSGMSEPAPSQLLIGNGPEGRTPFHGSIELPRLSILSQYPSEVFLDHAGATLATEQSTETLTGALDARGD